MKFWIRINGLQEGPMEVEQMKDYNVTPTTYVWCAGMKDWAYARDIEDLKDVIRWEEKTNTAVANPPSFTEHADEPATSGEPQDTDVAEDSNEATDTKEATATETVAETEQPASCQPTQAAEPEILYKPQPAAIDSSKEEEKPCPPNNLIWAILVTILCCQPFPICGIIAIIYAAQVNSKYYNDGYEAAKKASERAELWCIIGIVVGILGFSVIAPLMMFL